MRICFFGNVSNALLGKTPGGGELQIALLATALARAGHEVFVVDPLEGRNFETDDGVKVFSVPGWNGGVRIFRTLSHRIPALLKVLKAQQADVYYTRTRSFYNFLPFIAARKVNAEFVFAVASDLDVVGFKARLFHHYLRSMHPYDWIAEALPTEMVLPYLLRHADVVLAQHETQKMELERKNIPSIVFQNLIDIQSILSNGTVTRREGYAYVGSLDIRKGFKEFVQIAETVTDKKFKVIGQARGKGAEELCKRLQQLPNAKIYGRLSHETTINHIANSEALICTSPYEGFPNTFLEAWCVGTPVISLSVDPGGVIEKHKLGIVCHGNLEKFKEVVRGGADRAAFDRDALVRYISRYHSMGNAAESFIKIVRKGEVN